MKLSFSNFFFFSILFCYSFAGASQTKIITIYGHSDTIQESDLRTAIKQIEKEMRQKNTFGEITILKSYPGQKEWKVSLHFPDTESSVRQSSIQQTLNPNALSDSNNASEDSLNNAMNRLSNSLGADVYVTPKLHVH